MHFKMRGVGRGDLGAMQDIAVTPEVRYFGIFFSLTKNLQEVSGLRAFKTGIVRAWRQSKYCDVTFVASDQVEVPGHRWFFFVSMPGRNFSALQGGSGYSQPKV